MKYPDDTLKYSVVYELYIISVVLEARDVQMTGERDHKVKWVKGFGSS